MELTRVFSRAVATACAMGAVLLAGAPAHASPPSNDDFDSATIAVGTPYSSTIANANEGTSAPDDPPQCAPSAGSLWYRYTADASGSFEFNTRGSSYDTVLSVYTGARGALRQVGCNDDAYGLQSRVTADLTAGQTYFVEVAQFGPSMPGAPPAGLVFNIGAAALPPPPPPPPPNDEVAGATAIASLPYTTTEDTSGATAAPTDPAGCFYYSASSVWFSYTPTQSGAVVGDTYGSNYFATVSVYTGSPSALTLVSCGDGTVPRTDVVAGHTYYFMVSTPYALPPGYGAQLMLNLYTALTVSVTLNSTGLVVPSTGATQIRGTVTCNRTAYAYLNGAIRQRSGRAYIDASFNTAALCGTTPSPVIFTFRGTNGNYAGGPADVSLNAFSYGSSRGDFASATALGTVTLHGTSPKNLSMPTTPPPPPRP